jgi:hypothetical protein
MKNKNKHIIPTEKPSRLLMSIKNNLQFLKDKASLNPNNHFEGIYQNIYITSDEKPKDGDWCIDLDTNTIFKLGNWKTERAQKIILTTDKDLIKDGVQAIDDEFLEWFVKNPSCEEVEVDLLPYDGIKSIDKYWSGEYKIIIPKEEPKQYTSEELEGFKDFKNMISKAKQENCCTPVGQIKRYVDCVGCDKKPKLDTVGKEFYETADMTITVKRQEQIKQLAEEEYWMKDEQYERGAFVNGYSQCQNNMLEFLETEIKRAYIHGQSNGQMMEAGLERDEVEEYVNFRMLSFKKK